MQKLILNTVRKVTAILENISPRLTQWWLGWLFFSPRTTQRKAPKISGLEQSWLSYETTKGRQGRCRVYSAGTGPAVLLMHGWEGAALNLSGIASTLLENGMRVILFDMPAHGLSEGHKTNLIEVSRIAQNIATREGHLQAVIGHSFGAAVAGHAIKSGMNVDRFIAISAPSSMPFIVDHFCTILGTSEITKKGLIRQIETILRGSYEQESLTVIARQFNIGGLIIHDRNDRMVPYSQSESLLDAWPNAELITTESLGHNRILRSKDVIRMITQELLSAQHDNGEPVSLAVNQ